MADRHVGLIGAGIMGEPMGRNLLKAGFALTVHSRTRARAGWLLEHGAVWSESPAALAAKVDVVISVLPDSPDVESIYLGGDGVCTRIRSGGLAIDMSTVAPATAERVAQQLAQRGTAFLDAPVSGGRTGAEAGTLAIMVGGAAAAVERAGPIFAALGQRVVHCGPTGHGQLAKLCNQIICGLNLLAVGEAIVFAKRCGVDAGKMLEAVSAGAAGSWAVDQLGSRMLKRDFAPMFMIDLQQKDLKLALEAARSTLAPLPGTALVHQLLAANQAAGEGREGTQALLKTLERLAAV